MKSNYEDRVLIKLRRQYSKDETVASLNKKLKEIEFELGVLKSEKDEAEYKLKASIKQSIKENNVIKSCQDLIKKYKNKYQKQLELNKILEKRNKDLKEYKQKFKDSQSYIEYLENKL